MFRTDASTEIGGGHVMRSLALADGLAACGVGCAFAVSAATLRTAPELVESGYQIVEVDGDLECEPSRLRTAVPQGAAWLIVDHYGKDVQFERACRPWAERIFVIDDLANRPHDCDALLDQTLGRAARDYAGLASLDCRFLLGPQYALIRQQFAAVRAAALACREKSDAVRRILISFGTTDVRNLTTTTLLAMGSTGLRVSVDVVLGRAAPHLRAVHDLAQRLPFPVSVHEQVSDMAALMAEADLAVGAAGCTTWERCCLALPSVIVSVAENQQMIGEQCGKAGAAVYVGRAEDVSQDQLAGILVELSGNSERLVAMSRRAQMLCDGQGARRVAKALVGDA